MCCIITTKIGDIIIIIYYIIIINIIRGGCLCKLLDVQEQENFSCSLVLKLRNEMRCISKYLQEHNYFIYLRSLLV